MRTERETQRHPVFHTGKIDRKKHATSTGLSLFVAPLKRRVLPIEEPTVYLQ